MITITHKDTGKTMLMVDTQGPTPRNMLLIDVNQVDLGGADMRPLVGRRFTIFNFVATDSDRNVVPSMCFDDMDLRGSYVEPVIAMRNLTPLQITQLLNAEAVFKLIYDKWISEHASSSH